LNELVKLRDEISHDLILDTGREVYGLVQAVSTATDGDTIFDSDLLLADVFSNLQEKSDSNINSLEFKVHTNKIFLFADDSKFIRVMLEKLCNKMNLRYEIYENGEKLLRAIKSKKPSEIALIITDIEMPVMGGRQLLEEVRTDNTYNDVNIIVHTNMSNNVMKDELIHLGAQKIIPKVDMLSLGTAIAELTK
jgi:two-component system chemotaxis response regulator CheV